MKITLLSLSLMLLGASSVQSQESSLSAEEQRSIKNFFNRFEPVPTGNGWDDIRAAAHAVNSESLNPAIIVPKETSPAALLELQRRAVVDNEKVFALLQSGLRRGVWRVESRDDIPSFADNARVRNLSRLLIVRAQTQLADQNFAGALQTQLDNLELGVVAGRGGTISDNLTGLAVESLARAEIARFADKLDVSALQDAARHVREIETRRVSMLDVWRLEKNQALRWARQVWNEEASLNENFGLSGKEVVQVRRMGRDAILQNIDDRYKELARRTRQNYAQQIQPLPASDPYTSAFDDKLPPQTLVFSPTVARVQNELLALALELRARKLQTGAYPAIFATPRDLFSPSDAPLIYRKTGENYLLYSVGADGTDDQGKPAQIWHEKTKTWLNRVTRDAKGDILAPVLGNTSSNQNQSSTQ